MGGEIKTKWDYFIIMYSIFLYIIFGKNYDKAASHQIEV